MMSLDFPIERFSTVQILCVGDLMLDTFLYGSVNRISPEAPVPVFDMRRKKQMLGGAGNVVANLASLGCRTEFIGVVGHDEQGDQVSRFLEDISCRTSLIRAKDYPTTVKTRFVAGNHHLLRADQEKPLEIDAELGAELRKALEAAVPRADVVLMSDYGKGLFTAETAGHLIALCRSAGKTVIVDPKGSDYSLYAGATLVKPNLKEFEQVTGMKLHPGSEEFQRKVVEGAKGLFDRFGIRNLLVTLSEHGMIFISGESPDSPISIPTRAREVFDVSGAGDTSLATLGASLATGATMADAMQLANIASGIVVSKLGTASVTRDELFREIRSLECAQEPESPYDRILSRERAAALVERFKRDGKTVGFTNGCFDLLHRGHLHSFMQARALCDVLVVGLNSDRSVQRLKGPTRPVQDEQTRALLLSSLEFVDYVVVFDEETALPLIDLLRPDVIAKEGYPLDKWPEGQKVVSYGGQAVQLDRLDGYSTSCLVERMRTLPS